MSQLIEQALAATLPLLNNTENLLHSQPEAEKIGQLRNQQTQPIMLMPVLPSSLVDELFCRFGFKSNTRANLIRQGLFPKGASLRTKAMSTSLYSSLVVDLIALLARQTDKQSKLVQRLHSEINELLQTTLFEEVLSSLATRLPSAKAFDLAALTHLFRPTVNVPDEKGNTDLTLNYFQQLDWLVQQNWYRLALLQQQLRAIFFSSQSSLTRLENSLVTRGSHNPLFEIMSGVVEGNGHSAPGQSKVVFMYYVNLIGAGEIQELPSYEEVELGWRTLDWLGCDWVDAPVVRLEAALDSYDSHLVFYLPGIMPPINRLVIEARVTSLKQHVTSLGRIEGFERPWDENTLSELMAELEQEGNQV